jgi:hypothetical protein
MLYTTMMLAVAVPVILVARSRRRPSTIRNFLVGALGVGVTLAVIRVASELSVEQCENAGNTQCADYGSSGFTVLFIAGFTVIALGRAWALSR